MTAKRESGGYDRSATTASRRGQRRKPECVRGHLRVVTENKWGQCKECRNQRERDARRAVRV